MVEVEPIKYISGFRNIRPSTAIKAPKKSELKKLVDANIRASSTLFAPSLLDIFAPAPCPNIKPKACNIAINPKTIPTAPVALVPTVETKYVSAML